MTTVLTHHSACPQVCSKLCCTLGQRYDITPVLWPGYCIKADDSGACYFLLLLDAFFASWMAHHVTFSVSKGHTAVLMSSDLDMTNQI